MTAPSSVDPARFLHDQLAGVVGSVTTDADHLHQRSDVHVKQSGAMLPVLRKAPLAIIPATGGRHQRPGRRGRRRRRRSATLSAARAPSSIFRNLR